MLALAVTLLAGCSEDPIAPDRTPAALLLEGGPGTAVVGDTVRLRAAVVNAAGRALRNVPVTWQSTDTFVAAVDDSGRVEAREAGRVAIIARAGDVADTVAVYVEVRPRAILLTQTTGGAGDSAYIGGVIGYSARLVDGRGRTLYPAPMTFQLGSAGLATTPSISSDSSAMTARALAAGELALTVSAGGVRTERTVRVVLRRIRLAGSGLTQVGFGYSHGCGLDGGGRARCFGWSTFGELGRDFVGSGAQPITPVSGDLTFATLAVNSGSTCGITPQRRLWCWGALASPTVTAVPTAILPNMEIAHVSIGSTYMYDGTHQACALTTSGEAWCWSNNVPSRTTGAPALVDTMRRFRAIDVGGTFRSCAVTTTDRVACWFLGRSPVELAGSYPAFDQVAVADTTACGLAAGGAVWCWSLGTAYGEARPAAPRRVLADQQVTAIGATRASQCALTSGGDTWCWGEHPAWNTPYESQPLLQPRRLAPADRHEALAAGSGGVCGRYANGDWGCIGFSTQPAGGA